MTERRIPDPTLMARLQLSVKGVDWASSLVAPWQHEPFEGEWTAHQHVFHLLAMETLVYHPRIERILTEDAPTLEYFDSHGHMATQYSAQEDIAVLAERFMAARAETYERFKALSPAQWKRTGIWPDGNQIDLAWLAEKVLWHALDHFATLLDIHGEFQRLQAAD